jgi:hypothetical protein
MDFIIDLPPFSSYDSILVVVDCLMKMTHFIPCTRTIISKIIIKLFLDRVFWYHHLPKNIIFDREAHMHSSFEIKFLSF